MGWEGNVDRRAVAALGAHFCGRACAGIEGELVRAEEEHIGVVIEDVLGAVAVVHVEIHDEHPPHPMLLLRPARGDGHVGKDAEAHAVVDQGVVARRAHQGEAVLRLAPEDRVQQVEQPARGPQRRFVGVGVDVGVRIQVPAAPLGDQLEPFQVGCRVHAQDRLHRRRRAGHVDEPVEHAIFGEQVQRRLKAPGVLRVTIQRVAQIERIVNDGSPSHKIWGALTYRNLGRKRTLSPVSPEPEGARQLKIGVEIKFVGAVNLDSLVHLHRQWTLHGLGGMERCAIPEQAEVFAIGRAAG